jgi:pimeloyl-ACP methyl ester carboxylesterase
MLGFSIGSLVVQEITLARPVLLRRLVLASSTPKGAAGMHGWRQKLSARSASLSQPRKACLTSSTGSHHRAARPADSPWNAFTAGPRTAKPNHLGPVRPNVTLSARGESPTAPFWRGYAASKSPCTWPLGTATQMIKPHYACRRPAYCHELRSRSIVTPGTGSSFNTTKSSPQTFTRF